MVRSKFRGAVLALSALFTVACGGPVAEEAETAPAQEVSVAPEDGVSAQAYTCGETSGTCAPGYKCCYPCGVPDCQWQCMAVTRCPFYP